MLHIKKEGKLLVEKARLRKEMLSKRKNIPLLQRDCAAEQAQKHLLASIVWQSSSSVALYSSIGGEISTRVLLTSAWQASKQVYLPRIISAEQREMDFYLCEDEHHLQVGAFGIYEPRVSSCSVCLDACQLSKKSPTLFLVPGLAFSLQGDRLGMGGGYYDRYLSRWHRELIVLVGFCFAEQVLSSLTQEKHDIAMDYLCTELGFFPIEK